jgi:hypothetical protein
MVPVEEGAKRRKIMDGNMNPEGDTTFSLPTSPELPPPSPVTPTHSRKTEPNYHSPMSALKPMAFFSNVEAALRKTPPPSVAWPAGLHFPDYLFSPQLLEREILRLAGMDDSLKQTLTTFNETARAGGQSLEASPLTALTHALSSYNIFFKNCKRIPEQPYKFQHLLVPLMDTKNKRFAKKHSPFATAAKPLLRWIRSHRSLCLATDTTELREGGSD